MTKIPVIFVIIENLPTNNENNCILIICMSILQNIPVYLDPNCYIYCKKLNYFYA